MNNISKQFPGVKALEDVSLKLKRGEVFALVGENGAGKSTLIKILSGVYTTDTGEIKINGQRVDIKGPKNAIDLGINTIYQETSLVQDITVAENIFLLMVVSGTFPQDERALTKPFSISSPFLSESVSIIAFLFLILSHVSEKPEKIIISPSTFKSLKA